MDRTASIALLITVALAPTLPATAKLREAAMRLPDRLAAVERVPVKGRHGWKIVERVQFGGCDVYEVRRSFTQGGDLRVGRALHYEDSERRQTFGFSLAGPDGAVWISPSIDSADRAPVTAAIAALQLFEELRKTLPD